MPKCLRAMCLTAYCRIADCTPNAARRKVYNRVPDIPSCSPSRPRTSADVCSPPSCPPSLGRVQQRRCSSVFFPCPTSQVECSSAPSLVVPVQQRRCSSVFSPCSSSSCPTSQVECSSALSLVVPTSADVCSSPSCPPSAVAEVQQRVLPVFFLVVSNKSGRVQQCALPRRASAAAEVQQRVLPVFFLVVPTKSVLSVHRAPLRRVHQALVPCAVCPASAQYPQVYKHGPYVLNGHGGV
jgi:hypothetical protein